MRHTDPLRGQKIPLLMRSEAAYERKVKRQNMDNFARVLLGQAKEKRSLVLMYTTQEHLKQVRCRCGCIDFSGKHLFP
ncbi:hypothetical protein KSC_071140 [Ktedonobacter sp. SOSP1-52]|nr:hypothetical protein KSC_071140 [Ktedonobacter sp. SOSP1-52]